MKKLSSNEIRHLWLDFFKSKNHFLLQPKSLVPVNDPSLLWINSGVATLKDFFSGKINPPSKRLVNCQRSIRTNDIENVGVTSRHHTFFEMLGNFSIGDYFKNEAIEFAYEFLTKILNFNLDKIYITVFEDDIDAFNKWLEIGINSKHIIKCNRKRNFWDLGEGPCGPCTEIYYDRGPKFDPDNIGEKLFSDDIENDRYVEIWNIVFSQFDNDGKGNYTELIRKNIDTGAGLERLAAIIQNVPTNYDINTFASIYCFLEKHTDEKYESNAYFSKDTQQLEINRNFIVFVDHIRANVFAIADGAAPGNKERGSVLRKLIRRALLAAKKLKFTGNYIESAVNSIIENEKDFYPFLIQNKNRIIEILNGEISLFEKTLDTGLKLFHDSIKDNQLNGESTFKLVETHGFPLEMIMDLAREKNIAVNVKNFEENFKKHQLISKGKMGDKTGMSSQNDLINFMDDSEFLYDQYQCKNAKIIAVFDNNFNLNNCSANESWVVFDRTPFYATSGGQMCDTGNIFISGSKIPIEKVTKSPNGQHLHLVSSANLKIGDIVDLKIDEEKRVSCTRNHSAEHLLHRALTSVIAKDIKQEGASKTSDKLTFDFQNSTRPTEEQIQKVENKVNEYIDLNENVETIMASLNEAKKLGAFAYFENVYAKINTKLRVVKMGNTSIELCGGTHVRAVGDIERFLIVKCTPKGTGSFRIEAITSHKKIAEFIEKITFEGKNKVEKIISSIGTDHSAEAKTLLDMIEKINWTNIREFEKNLIDIEKYFFEYTKNKKLIERQDSIKKLIEIFENKLSKNINFQIVNNYEPKAIIEVISTLSNKHSESCFVCLNSFENKLQYYVATKNPSYSADEIVNMINKQVNGFGSGKKTFAQGGTNQHGCWEKIFSLVTSCKKN